jgi:hypothetical protein
MATDDDTPPAMDNVKMPAVKKRADELGCYMQLFIAYNPDTEMLMTASNAPDAKNWQEAALLLTLAADQVTERLKATAAAEPAVEGDDTPTLN